MRRFRDTQYMVSPDGTVTNRFGSITGTGKARGYFICGNRQPGRWYVHQMVMECYGTSSPGRGYVIDHIDENIHNNNITNLRWITIGENTSRATRRLTDEQICVIMEEYNTTKTSERKLAKKYGVSRSVIQYALNRRPQQQ